MKRLTTNDKNHILASLNMFYCKDNEVWVRHEGPPPDYADITLVELIRQAAKVHDLDIQAEDAERLGEEMYNALYDGVYTGEGVLALLHSAAVQAAEMRARLMRLEDKLGDEYEPDAVSQVRHGRWEYIKRHGSTRPYHCSCGYSGPGRFPYCPSCGAWMDGGGGSAAE